MKKLFTLLFAVALVTAASAQSGDRHKNDSRSGNNSYQSSPYSNNNQNGYSNQYQDGDQYNRNSQWNDRDRRQAEQQRYEMTMRRNQSQYRDERRYDNRSPGLVLPILGLLAILLSRK